MLHKQQYRTVLLKVRYVELQLYLYIILLTKHISIIGLKKLNERCENENSSETDESETDLTEDEKYQKKLLVGLKKIRRIAKCNSQDLKISGIRRMRHRFNIDIIRAFVHYGLSHVIQANNWAIYRSQKRISRTFSIQDEAWVLLLFMNNWDVWESIAKGGKRKKGTKSDTLFTNKKKRYNDNEIMMKGWNNDGLREFNNTLNYLVTVRNMDSIITLESKLLEEFKEIDQKRSRKRKRDSSDKLILADMVLPMDGYSQNFIQM